MKLLAVSVLALAACGGSSKPLPEPDFTPEPIAMRLTGVVSGDADGAAQVGFTLALDEADTYDCGELIIFDSSLVTGATILYEPSENAALPQPLPDGEQLHYFVEGDGGGLAITRGGDLLHVRHLSEGEGWTEMRSVALPTGVVLNGVGDGQAP